MATAYINIGSNLGDSHALTRRAAQLIGDRLGSPVRCSAPYGSAPWGYESGHRYVNLGVAVEVGGMSPLALLHTLQEVEREIDASPHRNDDGSYRDRYIDIDLIAVDDLILDTPELQLPHPRMHLRDFVAVPMAELVPDWCHPVLGLTIREITERFLTR